MDRADRERLYNRIDEDESLSDSERRAAYFGEIAEQEDRERWECEQCGMDY